MFTDRTDAGEQLADELASRGVEADVVLGVPRGGLPVAAPVAETLDAPLDVVVAKKVTLPHNQEYAIGAVTAEGDAWYDEDTIRDLGVDESELADQAATARERAIEKRDAFREGRPPLDVAGKRVVVVDDGLATGATMRACIQWLDVAGAERVVVAVPVASPTAVIELRSEVDDVVAPQTPEAFRAVGQFYDSFDQVSTAEALEYLEDSIPAP